MTDLKPVKIDIVSDVVCPWCYIGKRRLETALALVPGVPVELNWHPFQLQPDMPREGMARDAFIKARFGSIEAYAARAKQTAEVAIADGLTYRPDLIKRQPNTIDARRLIHWAASDPSGDKAGRVKQRLMELFFAEGGDLSEKDVLTRAAADCGMDADEIRRRLDTDEDVALTQARAARAAEQGVSGVPTYIFADTYAMSGAQPPEHIARALQQILAEINAPSEGEFGKAGKGQAAADE